MFNWFNTLNISVHGYFSISIPTKPLPHNVQSVCGNTRQRCWWAYVRIGSTNLEPILFLEILVKNKEHIYDIFYCLNQCDARAFYQIHGGQDISGRTIFYFRQKVEQSALSKILNSIIFSSNEKSTGLSHWIRTNCLV